MNVLLKFETPELEKDFRMSLNQLKKIQPKVGELVGKNSDLDYAIKIITTNIYEDLAKTLLTVEVVE